MPFRDERRTDVMHGDIAAGDGYVGIVADLPGGRVGLALFGEPGQPRRIVYIPSEACELVRRSWEWQGVDSAEREVAEIMYRRQNREADRER